MIASLVASSGAAPTGLIEKLYASSRAKYDPFGELRAAQGAAAAAMDCDLLICLGATPAVPPSSGALTVWFGETNELVPFWSEVIDGRETCTTRIYWHSESLAEGREVRMAETSTVQGLFFTLSSEEPVHAAIRMLAGVCVEIRERGVNRFRPLPMQRFALPARCDFVAAVAAAGFVGRKLARSAQLRFSSCGKQMRWFVALRPNTGKRFEDLSRFVDLPVPEGVDWIADPFVRYDYLLYEEMPTGSTRGRLGAIEILPGGKFGKPGLILDKNYHLSYPIVISRQWRVVFLPETSEAERVDL